VLTRARQSKMRGRRRRGRVRKSRVFRVSYRVSHVRAPNISTTTTTTLTDLLRLLRGFPSNSVLSDTATVDGNGPSADRSITDVTRKHDRAECCGIKELSTVAAAKPDCVRHDRSARESIRRLDAKSRAAPAAPVAACFVVRCFLSDIKIH